MNNENIVKLSDNDVDFENCFVLNGNFYDIGIKVIKWNHQDGYDGYTTKKVVAKKRNGGTKTINGKRYSKRAFVKKSAINKITQLMVHHSGADRRDPGVMYNVLYNQRRLSCHFACEDDGRIYQFNDALDCCWHAGAHNKISIGTECCLFPFVKINPNYYNQRNRKKTNNLPHTIGTDFIHGKRYKVFCFTDPQVDSLARLYAGIWFALSLERTKDLPEFHVSPMFPRIGSAIAKTKINNTTKHIGLIGHLQCTLNKVDPAGFPWEAFETLVGLYFSSFR
jgi:hypothetical protein